MTGHALSAKLCLPGKTTSASLPNIGNVFHSLCFGGLKRGSNPPITKLGRITECEGCRGNGKRKMGFHDFG